MRNFWIFFLIFLAYGILASIRNILIGKGIIRHPMYDTAEKKKYILTEGKRGLITAGICSLVIPLFYYFVIMSV
jgi:hypothetical protein